MARWGGDSMGYAEVGGWGSGGQEGAKTPMKWTYQNRSRFFYWFFYPLVSPNQENKKGGKGQ